MTSGSGRTPGATSAFAASPMGVNPDDATTTAAATIVAAAATGTARSAAAATRSRRVPPSAPSVARSTSSRAAWRAMARPTSTAMATARTPVRMADRRGLVADRPLDGARLGGRRLLELEVAIGERGQERRPGRVDVRRPHRHPVAERRQVPAVALEPGRAGLGRTVDRAQLRAVARREILGGADDADDFHRDRRALWFVDERDALVDGIAAHRDRRADIEAGEVSDVLVDQRTRSPRRARPTGRRRRSACRGRSGTSRRWTPRSRRRGRRPRRWGRRRRPTRDRRRGSRPSPRRRGGGRPPAPPWARTGRGNRPRRRRARRPGRT